MPFHEHVVLAAFIDRLPYARALSHAPPSLLRHPFCTKFDQDVAIVRQLLEDFVSASREAVLKLELLQNGDPSQLSGLPVDWTAEDASRLFNPQGSC